MHSRVTRIADWAGWCSPCQSADRPLVLTRSGPGGLRAWLAGHGDDDRMLLLTCRVCGRWQVVPAREEDDPEIVLSEDDHVVEVVAAALAPSPVAVVPSPRPAVPSIVTVPDDDPPHAAVSPQAVAAAAQVLSAARVQSQRTPPTRVRNAPLHRSRRSRRGPTARRTTRPAPACDASPQLKLPPSIALPAGTSQVVLAVAS